MSRQARDTSVDAIYSGIGKQITQARRRLGLSQEALGDRVHLTRTSITNIEHGRQRLMFHTFLDLAAALNLDPAELMAAVHVASGGSIRSAVERVAESADTKEWMMKAMTPPKKK